MSNFRTWAGSPVQAPGPPPRPLWERGLGEVRADKFFALTSGPSPFGRGEKVSHADSSSDLIFFDTWEAEVKPSRFPTFTFWSCIGVRGNASLHFLMSQQLITREKWVGYSSRSVLLLYPRSKSLLVYVQILNVFCWHYAIRKMTTYSLCLVLG